MFVVAIQSFAVIQDCTKLLDFATSIGLQQAQSAIYNQIQSNCCTGTVSGVVCSSNTITSIQWGGLGLTGVFDGSKLPPNLVTLDISNNQITGSISGLPNTLQNIYLSNNLLSETIDRFPNSLSLFYADHNQISGTLPNLNSQIIRFSMSYNQLATIQIDFTSCTQLVEFILNNNQIAMSMPQNWPTSLQHLKMTDNQITGNVPTFTGVLANLEISFNKLNGTIPLLPPLLTYLSLNYNKLTNWTLPFPNSIQTIDCNNNLLNVPFPPLPSTVTAISINNNNIHGQIPINWPNPIVFANLEFNPLLGDITAINWPPNLARVSIQKTQIGGNLSTWDIPLIVTELYLANSNCFGTLPRSMGRIQVLDVQSLGLIGPIQFSPAQKSAVYDYNAFTGPFPNLPNSLAFLSLNTGYSYGKYQLFNFSSSLTMLNLDHCRLFGRILALPSTLIEIHLLDNHFNGTISIPSQLQKLIVTGNQFSGSLTLPDALVDLETGGNLFSGTILLKQPMILDISNNQINDILVQDIVKLSSCDLSGNLLANSPHLSNLLPICKHDNLATYYPVTSMEYTQIISTIAPNITKPVIRTRNIVNMNTKMAYITSYSMNYEEIISRIEYSSTETLFEHKFTPKSILIRSTLDAFLIYALHFTINAFIVGMVVVKTPFVRKVKQRIEHSV
eukprot:NODE_772_length_3999_cov_0.519487.p1 type:complete len:673 gc:universal NODE_772_length_3999_cov_0.519487:3892-1874(-)